MSITLAIIYGLIGFAIGFQGTLVLIEYLERRTSRRKDGAPPKDDHDHEHKWIEGIERIEFVEGPNYLYRRVDTCRICLTEKKMVKVPYLDWRRDPEDEIAEVKAALAAKGET